MLRSTGGLRCNTQAVYLIRAICTVTLSVTGEGGGDTGSVPTGELVAAAGVVGAAPLITAVPAVVHTITSEEEEITVSTVSRLIQKRLACFFTHW